MNILQSGYSKEIRKVDEDAKILIIEVMKGEKTGGFDVDSIYQFPDKTWVIVEFLKCISVRPFDSHPNRYWFKNSQKFISLWNLKCDLKGRLILVNYEDSRNQFLVINVEEINIEKGITKEEKLKMDFEEFKRFFVTLNRRARGIDHEV